MITFGEITANQEQDSDHQYPGNGIKGNHGYFREPALKISWPGLWLPQITGRPVPLGSATIRRISQLPGQSNPSRGYDHPTNQS